MFKKKTTENQNFFFIRGFARSGTNWLNNILNLHPDIYATGEFNFWPLLKGSEIIKNSSWNIIHNHTQLQKELDNGLEKTFTEIIHKAVKKETNRNFEWIGDRTPNPIYPFPVRNGKVFFIIRDVRDVLISLTYHHLKPNKNTERIDPFPEMQERKKLFKKDNQYFHTHPGELLDEKWTLDSVTRWHKQTMTNIKTIEKFNGTHTIKAVRYEDLHNNLESKRAELYEFLDLDPNKAKSVPDLVQPGFKVERPGEHYRKGKVGDWKQYINESLNEKICNICHDSMKHFDYL